MAYKIWAVNGNLSHLLVVDGLHVINGSWDLVAKPDGTYLIPHSDATAAPVMNAPRLTREERDEYPYYNYHAAIAKAKEALRSRERTVP